MRVDNCLNERRAGRRQGLPQRLAAFGRIINRPAADAKTSRHSGKVDRFQITEIFRIAEAAPI